jgi:hypothetical protein
MYSLGISALLSSGFVVVIAQPAALVDLQGLAEGSKRQCTPRSHPAGKASYSDVHWHSTTSHVGAEFQMDT